MAIDITERRGGGQEISSATQKTASENTWFTSTAEYVFFHIFLLVFLFGERGMGEEESVVPGNCLSLRITLPTT